MSGVLSRSAAALLAAIVCCRVPTAEGRGTPGCSPGCGCSGPLQSTGTLRFIRAVDPLEIDPITHRPRAFFPNYRPDGPTMPSVQSLAWGDMLVLGTGRGSAIRATLNPDFRSTIRMESLQDGGVPMFPARSIVELFFIFDLGNGVRVFNNEPLTLVSQQPVTGFPPALGPVYRSAPVDLYDMADPTGLPVERFGSGELGIESETLFDVQLLPLGNGAFRASVATRQPGLRLPGKVFIAATPSFGLERREFDAVLSNTPSEFTVQTDQPSAPCFDYIEAWAISVSPDRRGFAFNMLKLPNAPSCPELDPVANAGGPIEVVEGDVGQLRGIGSSSHGPVRFSWVAPHGVTLDDPTSANPTFVAPATPFDRELVFTLFVDDGVNISRPDVVTVILRHAGPIVPCDANCDGEVNLADIPAFIQTLLGRDRPCSLWAADTDPNGVRNARDVQPFVECLLRG